MRAVCGAGLFDMEVPRAWMPVLCLSEMMSRGNSPVAGAADQCDVSDSRYLLAAAAAAAAAAALLLAIVVTGTTTVQSAETHAKLFSSADCFGTVLCLPLTCEWEFTNVHICCTGLP